MGSRDGKVVVSVSRIASAQVSQTFDDTIADGSVPGLGVKNKIDEGVEGPLRVANYEGSGIQALSQASPDLIRICITHKVDLNTRTGDICFPHAKQILVAEGYWSPET